MKTKKNNKKSAEAISDFEIQLLCDSLRAVAVESSPILGGFHRECIEGALGNWPSGYTVLIMLIQTYLFEITQNFD